VGGIYSGIPSINTRSIQTQVLVSNGDTVVLGGVYEQSTSEGNTKVPLLGDIPILGYLFRTTSKTESKSELLIFVTPKILSDNIKAGM
jgi:type IV pilus assembly protein PilQ